MQQPITGQASMNGFFPQPRIKFEKNMLFHNFLIVLDRLELAPPWVWGLSAFALSVAVTQVWDGLKAMVFFSVVAPLIIEAVAITYVSLKRAPGPFAGPFFLFMCGHAGAALITGFLPIEVVYALSINLIIQISLLVAMLHSSLAAPFKIRFREVEVDYGKRESNDQNIKFLLVSDLHLEKWGVREDQVLAIASDYEPDLILFPGDFTNLSFVGDPVAENEMARFLESLNKIAPLYASRGTPEVDAPWWTRSIFSKAGLELLEDDRTVIMVKNHKFCLVGVSFDRDEERIGQAIDRLCARNEDFITILLLHSPDLIHRAAKAGVDLYVAGHTHGGQIRFPLIGPLYTASRHGKRFAWGTHQVGCTTLVVSQGIGLEGGGAPRMRFLSPPEVVGIKIKI
jgi:uncharacterized protein